MAVEKEDYEKKEVDTDSIKCTSCGSNMVFDPKTQMLSCPHCGRKESFAKDLQAEELSILNGFEQSTSWNDESVVFRCENCGAKVVLDKSETAKLCPFCGTAHVVETDELAGIKPNAVLPFTISADEAAENCKKWARKKWFAPRKFKKSIAPENINGVYAPCFTFDSVTFSRYAGRIGKRHTRTVGSGKNQRTETYIVWRDIGGNFDWVFDDITVTAGSRLSQSDLDKLAPFDSNNSKAYENKYLLGFMAYHYEKSISDSWAQAKGMMDAQLKNLILSQYSYDVVDYFNISTSHTDVTYKYVLLPVYVGNYTYAGKLYGFIVNGTNGKVVGKSPKSFWKIALVTLLCVGIAALLVWLILSAGGEWSVSI